MRDRDKEESKAQTEDSEDEWWHGGADEAKAEASLRKNKVWPFALKVGESRKVIFVEDVVPETFGIWQHRLKLDNDFKNTHDATCTRGRPKGCPICQRRWTDSDGKKQEFDREHFNIVTVVDLTPYKKDAKTIYWCTKRLLMVKVDTFNILCEMSKKIKDEDDEENGLKHQLVDITRISVVRPGVKNDMSPRVGNQFMPKGRVVKGQFPIKVKVQEHDRDTGAPKGEVMTHPGLVDAKGKPFKLEPLDYRSIFQPRTEEEIDSIFKNYAVSDGLVFNSGAGVREETEESDEKPLKSRFKSGGTDESEDDDPKF